MIRGGGARLHANVRARRHTASSGGEGWEELGWRAAGEMGLQPASAAWRRRGGCWMQPGGEGRPGDGDGLGRGAGHAREVHGPVAVIGLVAVSGKAVRRKAADHRDHRERRDDREDTVTQV